MIEVGSIIKDFGNKRVLDNVSARFEPGKCSYVIGASGGGKSVFDSPITNNNVRKNLHKNRRILIIDD